MCCSSTVNSARMPPRLPHVGSRREPVRRAADDVAAKAQARIADAPVRARRLRLQPVEQAEAELPRRFVLPRLLGRRRRRRPGRTSSRSAASSPRVMSLRREALCEVRRGRECDGNATRDDRLRPRTGSASAARASRAAPSSSSSKRPGQPGGRNSRHSSYCRGFSMVWSSPGRCSIAKQTVIACWSRGSACSAAWGSPVSERDSAPSTCSTPARSSRSRTASRR